MRSLIGKYWLLALIAVICTLIFIVHLQSYIIWNVEPILGMVILVISILKDWGLPNRQGQGWPWFVLSFLFAFIHIFSYSKSFLILSLISILFWVIDQGFRRIEWYQYILLVLCLPFYQFCENAISIPLRLEQSEVASDVLNFFGQKCRASGNILIYNGREYIIDVGCAGLKMMRLTLIFCAAFIFAFQDSYGTKVTFWRQQGYFVVFVILNLVCNLIRIIILVLFDISESSWVHYLIGLISLGFYVLLPMVIVMRRIFQNIERSEMPAKGHPKSNMYLVTMQLVSVFIVLGVLYCHTTSEMKTEKAVLYLPGYKNEMVMSGVRKYTSGNCMIYEKAIPTIFSLEHNPTVCWSVEGFVLKRIGHEYPSGIKIVTGEFEKGNEKIFAAWWFTDGEKCVTDQFSWRFNTLVDQKKYVFVNVNTTNKAELLETVKILLCQKLS